MKVQVLLSLLVLLVLNRPGSSQGYHFCGRVLTETLMKYCSSSRMGDQMKRSDTWMRSQLFGTGNWLAPQLATGMGRGKRQGVATHCCENSCTFSELLSYCPL